MIRRKKLPGWIPTSRKWNFFRLKLAGPRSFLLNGKYLNVIVEVHLNPPSIQKLLSHKKNCGCRKRTKYIFNILPNIPDFPDPYPMDSGPLHCDCSYWSNVCIGENISENFRRDDDSPSERKLLWFSRMTGVTRPLIEVNTERLRIGYLKGTEAWYGFLASLIRPI